jgi:hypothetical protein
VNINLQPINMTAPTVEHRDFPEAPQRPAFSTAVITIGDDQITVFLPYMGRLNYTTEETK